MAPPAVTESPTPQSQIPNPQSLNPNQAAAIAVLDAPLVITAGPGTGKTRTLTMRMAHLLAQGVAPESILAITFTNKAAVVSRLGSK